MRFTLFQPSRSYASVTGGAPNDPPAGEAGVDAESWFTHIRGGGPDVNPELTGSAKFDVYAEMAKTDTSIKALQMFWSLPVRAAVWGLNPRAADGLSEPDAQAKVIRDAVNAQFGIEQRDESWLDMSWKELLAQGLKQLLTHGPCVEELVWDDLRTWTDADGDPHLIRPLARLALRPARTITNVVTDKGRVTRVEQVFSPGARPIPGDKVSYMVFEREDNRWDGVSPLRPCWGPWTLKKALMIAAGIGWDRFAAGLPVVYHPENDDAAEKAREIGRQVRTHERGYVHFPSDGPSMSGNGRPESGWFMEILNGASTLADPVPLLREYTSAIYEAGMLQFARQGFGDTGARATAETQIDPYFIAVSELADYIRRERARQAIRRFVEVNFGQEMADTRTPQLTVSKVKSKSLLVTAQVIAQLDAAGFTLNDRDVQNDMREELGFNQLPEEMAQAGITAQQLDAALRAAGLTPEQLAAIVNALPDGVGVTRNVVPQEGTAPAANGRPRVPPQLPPRAQPVA
jgi:hypothetical protein